MPVFVRRSPAPPQERDYKSYRAFVREDFRQCCAYCLLHELLAAGAEDFELDHFRPQSNPSFQGLRTDFYNLYYSCHVCNQTKRAQWPSVELVSLGYRFVDTCNEYFSGHFREEENSYWTPLTKVGEYSEKRLRLNRTHLIRIRGFFAKSPLFQHRSQLVGIRPARRSFSD